MTISAHNKQVLVTGANGFIGQVLCQALIDQGYKVRAVSRSQPIINCQTFFLDLAKDEYPENLCADIDIIFHLAGKAHALSEHKPDEQSYFQINTQATEKLLVAAQKAGVKSFIYFSSVKAVGDKLAGVMDETVNQLADNAYGRSKFAAEQLVLLGHFVPHPVVLRPCMVYGNTHKGNLPKMIKAIKRGLFPPLPEVHNRRAMVHVNDVVAAALLTANLTQAKGQIYIISDDHYYSTRQLYNWIRVALGKPVNNWSIPYPVLLFLAKIGDIVSFIIKRRFIFDSDNLQKLTGSAYYSSAKIKRELGYCPKHSLPTALDNIIAYLNTL